MEELFRDYWWLIFPIFGMAMAFWGMVQDDRRARNVLNVIRSYTDQGKEPPPELLKLAQEADENAFEVSAAANSDGPNSRAWTVVLFLALAAGFGTGYWLVQHRDFAWVLLIATVTMGVLAVGGLFILLFGRK